MGAKLGRCALGHPNLRVASKSATVDRGWARTLEVGIRGDRHDT